MSDLGDMAWLDATRLVAELFCLAGVGIFCWAGGYLHGRVSEREETDARIARMRGDW